MYNVPAILATLMDYLSAESLGADESSNAAYDIGYAHAARRAEEVIRTQIQILGLEDEVEQHMYFLTETP